MEISEQKISELKQFIFDGQYTEIDKWFSQNIINKIREEALVKQLLNETFLFSFKSLSTDVKVIEQERLKREKALLKNIRSNKNKLSLFHAVGIEDFSLEHLECLDIKNTKEILSNPNFLCSMIKLFNQQKFLEIEMISKTLGENVLEAKTLLVPYHRKENYGSGVSYFNFKEQDPFFAVKDDIILNFTIEKLSFLMDNNIEIPDYEKADEIKDKLLQYIKKSDFFQNENYAENINVSIDNFKEGTKIIELNKVLQNNLSAENKIAKKFKL